MGEEGDGRPDMVNRDPNSLNDNLMVSVARHSYATLGECSFTLD